MMKNVLVSCVAAVVLGGTFSATSFANDVTVAPSVHWGKSPINNSAGVFKNGKSFCSKKYIGRKTCIPGMNNTADTLTFSAPTYNSDNAPTDTVVTLMGKLSVPSVVYTVQDTGADGKVSTVYSGPANNKEGVVCNQDKTTKAITCAAWK